MSPGTPTGYCPTCERESPFTLHSDRIPQHKKIAIKPIFPTCLVCGAAVQVRPCATPAPGRQLLALTGACASGKSSIAELLVARHGFSGIDGNNVMAVARYKCAGAKVTYNGAEVLREIADEIDILLALQQDIVLSHVIVPDDLPRYRELFRRRGLHYKIIVLQPPYATAVSRSKGRTTFDTLTDETWIKHFHEQMAGFTRQADVAIFDNSDLDIATSAERILRMFHEA